MTLKEKIIKANQILGEMNTEILSMKNKLGKGYNQITDSEAGEVTMTQAQKQKIIDAYIIDKADLVALFQQLP